VVVVLREKGDTETDLKPGLVILLAERVEQVVTMGKGDGILADDAGFLDRMRGGVGGGKTTQQMGRGGGLQGPAAEGHGLVGLAIGSREACVAQQTHRLRVARVLQRPVLRVEQTVHKRLVTRHVLRSHIRLLKRRV